MQLQHHRTTVFSHQFLLRLIVPVIALVIAGIRPGPLFAQGPIEVAEQFSIATTMYPAGHSISGDMVVFSDGSKIYGYDLSTMTLLPDFEFNGITPDIFGNFVVWANGGNIFGYDLTTRRMFQITNDAATQKWPVVDGNKVVWVDWRHGGDNLYGNAIYGYDLNTRAEFRLTTSEAHGIHCLDISGNTVVWSDNRTGVWQVYAYNLVTQSERPITAISWPVESLCPAISGDVIAIGVGSGDTFGVYGVDLAGNLLFDAGTYLGRLQGPVAIDGEIVAWSVGSETYIGGSCLSDLYGYEITSKQKFHAPINDAGYSAWWPKISGNLVVWQGCPRFDPFICGPQGLYASRLLETVKLSASSLFVDPGDAITYTITLVEATTEDSSKSITNTHSPFTTLDLASLSATGGDFGYNPAAQSITWTGTVSSANPVTISYRVQVGYAISPGDPITNVAAITDETTVFSRTATAWIPRRTYLPVIIKEDSPG